jgi:hypothetical protein
LSIKYDKRLTATTDATSTTAVTVAAAGCCYLMYISLPEVIPQAATLKFQHCCTLNALIAAFIGKSPAQMAQGLAKETNSLVQKGSVSFIYLYSFYLISLEINKQRLQIDKKYIFVYACFKLSSCHASSNLQASEQTAKICSDRCNSQCC